MSKIEINILGTTAGAPTKERAHATIHLVYDDANRFCCLFDCGENAQRQLMLAGLSIMKLNDIFITHWHGDHCLGLGGLKDTLAFEGREHPITIFSPEPRRAKKSLGFTHSAHKFKVISRRVPAKGKKIKTLLKNKRFDIVSIPVEHGVPAVAYALMEKDKSFIDKEKARKVGLPEEHEVYRELKERGKAIHNGKEIFFDDIASTEKGKKIVYSGDTEICDSIKELAKCADLLIQDCTYFTENPGEKNISTLLCRRRLN